MDQKRLSGFLLTAAGTLFLLAGLIRRLQEPLWLILGLVFILLGLTVLRARPRS